MDILGQNSAFFRGTLEKMPAEGLQNCPRAGGPRAVMEARGRHLFKSPEEKGGILTLLTSFPTLVPFRREAFQVSKTMAFWEYCFSEYPLFGNHGILGRMPPCSETTAFWAECPLFGNHGILGRNSTFFRGILEKMPAEGISKTARGP